MARSLQTLNSQLASRMIPPNRSTAQKSRLRFLWPVGVLLLLVIFSLMIFRGGPPIVGALSPVTNAAGVVSLVDFTSAETHRWRTAPRGTQVCDGVTFVCQGALRTAGWNATRDGNR